MSTLGLKLLGTAVLGAVASGTVSVIALDLAPAEGYDWSKITWPQMSALDAGASRAAPQAEITATDVPGVKEETAERPIPADRPAALPSAPATAGEPGSGPLRIGDKLKIGFYERTELDEERWGRQRSLRPAFQQRMELSGEYTVNDDGAISVPLIGSFPVTKRGIPELEAMLANAAEAMIGRKGFVTIAALERQPVYILGPVKNPGSYKYAPGMTILHAVALAGGLERASSEPWQRMEAVRETGRRHGAIERTVRLIARVAVLKSEYAGGQPETPSRLVRMVGIEAARSAVREQKERRQSVVWMRQIRESAARSAVENAAREAEALGGALAPLEDNVKMRAGRVENLKTLKNSNVVTNMVLVQAQSELSDVQERRQAALNTAGLAKYRLAAAEQELARLQAETHAGLEQEITAAEQDIAEAEREIGSSEGVLKVVQAGAVRRDAQNGDSNIIYQIVRQTSQGATIISSPGTASLEPGDLVRVHVQPEAEIGTVEAKLP
jgi:exopolysaccharide production protein ExoF